MEAVHHAGGHLDTRMYRTGSIDPIHIKPANRGKITAGIKMQFVGELDATVTSVSYVIPKGMKIRVTNAHVVMSAAGSAGMGVSVDDGTLTIVPLIDCATALDDDIVPAAQLVDAAHELQGGETLRMLGAAAIVGICYVDALVYE